MSESREPIIRVEHLTARYGDNTVFDDVSFEVFPGEIFVILGGSGCGKSTMLKHMIGQYRPAEGEIRVCGENIAGAYGEAYERIIENFGVMYQMGALFGSMTLMQNKLYSREPDSTLSLKTPGNGQKEETTAYMEKLY